MTRPTRTTRPASTTRTTRPTWTTQRARTARQAWRCERRLSNTGNDCWTADALSRMVRTVDHYIEHGVVMTDLKSPRVVQITITVKDLGEAVPFYRDAFDAAFIKEISSFQFGTWPGDDFFLLTVAHEPNAHGRHEGRAGASRFGLLVADVDAAHRRALEAGAAEVLGRYDAPWKPRSSSVTDPSGNRIDLVQG